MPQQNAPTLAARFGRLEAAVVHDVLERMGWPHQVLSDCFRPLAATRRMAGPACCFKGSAVAPGAGSGTGRHSAFVVEETVQQGAIAVVAAAKQSRGAIFGGLTARALLYRRCAGVVIEGHLRDALEIEALGLTAYSCGVTPVGSRDWQYESVDVSVTLPGQSGEPVVISPGDMIVGDGDGIAVVPHAIAELVADHSERTTAMEDRIAHAIAQGMTREVAFAAYPRFEHISPLRGGEP